MKCHEKLILKCFLVSHFSTTAQSTNTREKLTKRQSILKLLIFDNFLKFFASILWDLIDLWRRNWCIDSKGSLRYVIDSNHPVDSHRLSSKDCGRYWQLSGSMCGGKFHLQEFWCCSSRDRSPQGLEIVSGHLLKFPATLHTTNKDLSSSERFLRCPMEFSSFQCWKDTNFRRQHFFCLPGACQ